MIKIQEAHHIWRDRLAFWYRRLFKRILGGKGGSTPKCRSCSVNQRRRWDTLQCWRWIPSSILSPLSRGWWYGMGIGVLRNMVYIHISDNTSGYQWQLWSITYISPQLALIPWYAPHHTPHANCGEIWLGRERSGGEASPPVSYTHLTLPTKRIV